MIIIFRSVKLSLHPQGEVLLFPCINDRVSLASVQTVFPQATGLKHFEQSVWKVVPIANGDFLLPPAVEHFVVVTGLIGKLYFLYFSFHLMSSGKEADVRFP